MLVFVAGTGTEVGKTWWRPRCCARLRQRRGCAVGARKPAQSFDAGDGPTDADVLAAATGEPPDDRVPAAPLVRACAMAPPMAADALGRHPFTDRRPGRRARAGPTALDVGLVEGAGGPRSPLADDGDTVDLARRSRPTSSCSSPTPDSAPSAPCACRSTPSRDAPILVVLNRYDEDDVVQHGNRDWLRDRDGYDVVTGPETAAARIVP